ncbi:MAG: RNA-directed DNA polymerase [Clostridia bacterium]|nr:RNA-directed DNA polymerase [Clostridia bacterium]
MITYKEISSLENDLGVSAKALYTLTNEIHRHYRTVMIPKDNGELRKLSVPDPFLKSVQRKIAHNILFFEEISPYATAYRPGGSTLINALPHVSKNTVMKLDINKFFDHIIYPIVKEKVFPAHKYSEANRILLTLICIYKDSLPQGAPTSPVISNIVLKDFDNKVGEFCFKRNVTYTRYCDDMTFSGEFDPQQIKRFLQNELKKLGLYLNSKKTVILKNGQQKKVTGIVVNEKPNVCAKYKRKLRQEIYFCQKYGIKNHLDKTGSCLTEAQYKAQLLGRINYCLSVSHKDKNMQGFKEWLINNK